MPLNFRGDSAAASLKLDGSLWLGGTSCHFRGDSAAASLKLSAFKPQRDGIADISAAIPLRPH